MAIKIIVCTFIFTMHVPVIKGAMPGTFFWKPRLGLDLSVPTSEKPPSAVKPSIQNIKDGKVVILEGYQVGMTLLALCTTFSSAPIHLQLNPTSSFFYTNSYRWALRYLNLLPPWISGTSGNYCETHRLWKRRFHYMDELVPNWLRKVLFFVNKEEWEQEEKQYKRFTKYAEPAFGKHYRYPSKVFNDFASYRKKDTVENLYRSSVSDKL